MLDLAGSDHDEAPPQTPAARSKAQAATPWTGQKVPLKRDFTPKENKTHKQSYQRGTQECSQCRYGDLIEGQHRQFAMRSHVPQKVTRKVEVLARLPWLALKHDDAQGGNSAGCVACRAYAQERPHKARPNIDADFSIGAAKLLDTTAAVLLRHAKTRLHLQAVASLLDGLCSA